MLFPWWRNWLDYFITINLNLAFFFFRGIAARSVLVVGRKTAWKSSHAKHLDTYLLLAVAVNIRRANVEWNTKVLSRRQPVQWREAYGSVWNAADAHDLRVPVIPQRVLIILIRLRLNICFMHARVGYHHANLCIWPFFPNHDARFFLHGVSAHFPCVHRLKAVAALRLRHRFALSRHAFCILALR